ncbi:MAG: MATE family efflux transporter [Syntrophomonadaceae bacterium]|nr:MATE family efflux transporter [Syntrophomonadaceae bacterium]
MGSLIIRLSGPAIAGMILYSLLSIIDTIFVARLGALPLAALTLTIPVQILLVSLSSATGTGITSLIGRTLGSSNIKMANNIAWHGIIISLVYGLGFMLLGLMYVDSLLLLFGCTAAAFSLCHDYLFIVLSGSMSIFIPMTLGNIIQGEGNTVTPVLVSLCGMVLNVLLDPLFMFGIGIFPPLGLNGAAVAGILAQIICTVLMIIIIRKSHFGILTWNISHFRADWQIIKGIYQVGMPTMVMELAGVVVLALLNRVLVGYGFTAVAAMGIFMRVRSLAYMPVFGLANAVMPVAAFAFGAGKLERVKETLVKSISLAVFFITAGWLFMQLQPAWIMSFFTQDAYLIKVGESCIRLTTLFLPVMGPLIMLSTVLQSTGRGMQAMWIFLSRQGVFCLLIFLLSGWYDLQGVWLAFSISELLSAVMAVPFIWHFWEEQSRKKIPVQTIFMGRYLVNRWWAWLR